MSDSTFVEAMAELQRIETDSLLAHAQRADARLKALQERGLTSAALERKARSVADDPKRALAILNAIGAKLRQADSTARPGGPSAPERPAQ
jgi:hypothetical protein